MTGSKMPISGEMTPFLANLIITKSAPQTQSEAIVKMSYSNATGETAFLASRAICTLALPTIAATSWRNWPTSLRNDYICSLKDALMRASLCASSACNIIKALVAFFCSSFMHMVFF